MPERVQTDVFGALPVVDGDLFPAEAENEDTDLLFSEMHSHMAAGPSKLFDEQDFGGGLLYDF